MIERKQEYGAINGYIGLSKSGRTCATCKQLRFCNNSDNDKHDHFCHEEKNVTGNEYRARGEY